MSPIRALIVDDEPLARTRIRLMLKEHPDIDVLAECGNGREAATLMRQEQPDLLFLDIEMPDLSGFDTLEQTAGRTAGAVEPVVICVTAHEEFALDAFEANAVDYLVKPFDQERFDRALGRARRFLALRPAPMPPSPQPARIRERFAVRGRGQIIFVKAVNIEWIGAEGNYARLYTREGSYLIRESLQHLEETIDPATFVRVHRSAIVNIERVGKLVPGPEGTYSIVLQNDIAIPLGPTFRARLESLLGQKL
jgi:two-component system LytT family response regulator